MFATHLLMCLCVPEPWEASKKILALRKFGFADGLEQTYARNENLGEIYILEVKHNQKKRKTQIENLEITIFWIFCPNTIHQPVLLLKMYPFIANKL